MPGMSFRALPLLSICLMIKIMSLMALENCPVTGFVGRSFFVCYDYCCKSRSLWRRQRFYCCRQCWKSIYNDTREDARCKQQNWINVIVSIFVMSFLACLSFALFRFCCRRRQTDTMIGRVFFMPKVDPHKYPQPTAYGPHGYPQPSYQNPTNVYPPGYQQYAPMHYTMPQAPSP